MNVKIRIGRYTLVTPIASLGKDCSGVLDTLFLLGAGESFHHEYVDLHVGKVDRFENQRLRAFYIQGKGCCMRLKIFQDGTQWTTRDMNHFGH